ncbi:MAG TPA: right-handed parallel beta-helix repeat-containing protein [bacterium]|nr:right-handed parallel beta-helix repeat-containing protein [bacterium]
MFPLLIACDNEAKEWRLPEACQDRCAVVRGTDDLADAVANATDAWNDCVCIDVATITTAVTVSKPLTIVGKGSSSRIVAPAGERGLLIRSDDVTLRDIEIASDTVALDIAQADGVALSGVRLVALPPAEGAVSFALAMKGGSITLTDTALTGSPDAATAAGELAGSQTILNDVTMTGFGRQGLVVTGGAGLRWTGGGIADIRTENAALFVTGSSATLNDIIIEKIAAPVTGSALYGGRGIVATDHAIIEATALTVRDCLSIGILIDGDAYGILDEAVVTGNGMTGIWLQRSGDVPQLSLQDSTITGNRAAGIAAFRSCGLGIFDTRIAGTLSAQWHDALVGDGLTAYGVELDDADCVIRLERVVFADNFRAGFIADGAEGNAALAGLSFSGVTVERSTIDAPGKYGIVIQNGTAPTGLSDGVTANPFDSADAALAAPLPIMTGTQDLFSVYQ